MREPSTGDEARRRRPPDEDLSQAHGFGATRTCEHGYELDYLAHMEWNGPDGVAAVLAAAVRADTVCGGSAAHRADSPLGRPQPLDDEPEASLTVFDRDGRHLDDRCIPRRTLKRPGVVLPPPHLDDKIGLAWQWWSRAVEMRLVHSECPVCPAPARGGR